MAATQDPTHELEPSSEVRPSAPRSGRLVRQASISSLGVVVLVVGVAVVATSIGKPAASPPAGAVGVVPSGTPTEPAVTWIPIGPTSAPTSSADFSANPSDEATSSVKPTAWRTSPPSKCDPYVKPCDPTVQPVYPYVRALITSNGSTDADIGYGKVTISAGGHTWTCSTYSRTPDCYWQVPIGTVVTATAARQSGSVCTYFQVMWEDYTHVTHDDCSPITFTQKDQMAQLVANFDKAPPATPKPPTDPPTDPPATPEPPEPTPDATPVTPPSPEASTEGDPPPS